MRRLAVAVLSIGACSDRPPAPTSSRDEVQRPASAPAPRDASATSALAAAFTRARAERKGVLVHFRAAWAMSSQELATRLRAPAVASAIAASFVSVEVDMTEGGDDVEAVREQYGLASAVGIVVVATDGTVLERVTSVPDEHELRALLERAAARLRSP